MNGPGFRVRFAFAIRPLLVGKGMSTIAAVAAAGAFAVPGSTAMPSGGAVDPIASASANPAILAPPDAIVGEADGTVEFVVRLAEEGLNTVTVNYSAANGTAGAGGSCNFDFTTANGTLTFAVGDVSELVSVEINDCADVEGFEAFTLGLSAPVNGTIARASSQIGIVDDDTVVDTPNLFVRDVVVDEKAGTASFVVMSSAGPAGQASNGAVTVDYATANGTATAGSDYGATGTLTFAPARRSRPSSWTSPTTPPRRLRALRVDLSNASGATILDGRGGRIGASDGTASSPAAHLGVRHDRRARATAMSTSSSACAPGQNPVSVDYTMSATTPGELNACTATSGSAGRSTSPPARRPRSCASRSRRRATPRTSRPSFQLSSPTNATIAKPASDRIVDDDTRGRDAQAVRARRGGRREGRHRQLRRHARRARPARPPTARSRSTTPPPTAPPWPAATTSPAPAR